jgi:hypothetical protein
VEPAARNWWPEDDDDYEAASTELKQRFGAWAADNDVELRGDAGEGLLHYKWGYIDGHLRIPGRFRTPIPMMGFRTPPGGRLALAGGEQGPAVNTGRKCTRS